MLIRYKLIVVLLTAFIFAPELISQRNNDLIRVTRDGRMVWRDSGGEAFFWGVNYTTPFAHAHRQIARLGEDREKAIDADNYYMPFWYTGKGNEFSLGEIERMQMIIPSEGNGEISGFELISIILK